MKKIHKLTSFLTAATMALSMSVSFSAAAVMQPEEGKKAYADLQARARAFRVDDAVLNQKYNNAKTRIQNNTGTFDIFSDRPYGDEGINYGDYQVIRDTINYLYKKDGFNKKSFPLSEIADYNRVRCDVDGDGELSYYDYCSMLRYVQEQIGLTDDYTDLTRKTENQRLQLVGGEGAVGLKKLVSDKENITLPSEICCKVKLKGEDGKLVDSWCILPVIQIEKNAFSKCTNMKKLTIRNYIQPEWFMKPEGYDCEEALFSGKLRAIENGGTVADCTYIDIKDGAFNGCTGLETVNFQENVNFSQKVFTGTKFGSSSNVYNADNGICYVKSSDGRALAACGIYDPYKALKERNGILNFDIEDGTTTITSNLRTAFNISDKNKEISLNIPDSVRYIHNDAFSSGETFDYSSDKKINVDCYSIKWVNGKSFEELCVDYEGQRIEPETLDEDERKKWTPTFDEFLRNNNGSFKGTQFMADPVKNIIAAKVKEIKADPNNKTDRDKIEAVCKYIFEQAEYSTYVDGDYALSDFSLFPNDLYNTLDEARTNNFVPTNAFLTHHTMCESYSYAVSLMLDSLGIINHTMGCNDHAYNIVYVDGKWQIVDMSVYGSFDRNYALYSESEDTSFIRNELTISNNKDKYALHPNDPKNLYGESGGGYYPAASIAGSSKLAVFKENNGSSDLIAEDVHYNIVGLSDDQTSITIALPSGNIPRSIEKDIAAGRINVFNGNGIVRINGSDYYFENNRIVTGPCWRDINGKHCYIKADNSIARDEIVEIPVNGEKVSIYFNDDHSAYTGAWYSDDMFCYYDGYNGMLKNGYGNVNGVRYYFDNEGRMEHGEGWFSFNGGKFYFKNNNTLACDEDLELPVDGKMQTFRFNSNGTLFIGIDRLNDGMRYFSSSGIVMHDKGWYEAEPAKWFYFKDTGVVAYDEDYEISGNLYRFNYDGTFFWGFGKKDGYLRFFDLNNGMLKNENEFYNYDNETYYFKENGILACNEWLYHDDNYYLFSVSGRMFKNSFVELDGAYYHLDNDGIMAANSDVEWKNGIKLHASANGDLDLSVLSEYQKAEFQNEAIVYANAK
ncbi:MAG: leucine-rich repeat protein [Ruminococcus sp.]|nr:leucine-rich repeat protein [Ruminococcus sp.]